MPNTIIVGAQWGDEGKGKIVDFLTEDADVVVRTQGGNNAGHTVIIGERKYVLHLIPSGVLWPDKVCVIGNGVVLDPVSLAEEIAGLRAKEIDVTPDNLLISESAHLVMPFHRGLDAAREQLRGDRRIGTTGRGIGPAYADKIQRIGIRVGELRDPAAFAEAVYQRTVENNTILEAADIEPIDPEAAARDCLKAGEELLPHVTNTVAWLHEALCAKKQILFEGAQGTYLDIDHGTYPFVTSSNTTAGGACTGSGVPPRRIDRVVGVAKAYTTRVGAGPFVTEDDELSERLHEMGREFGATTGRARRCGWLDLPLLRFAHMVNGFDELAVTNLDGLDACERIKICTAYRLDGHDLSIPPSSAVDFARCEPVCSEVAGWKSSTTEAQSIDDLPSAARDYLDLIGSEIGAPVTLVGVGPERSQTLRRNG